jgi:hypothetical protein
MHVLQSAYLERRYGHKGGGSRSRLGGICCDTEMELSGLEE